MKVHGSVMSTAAQRVFACLNEKELEFEFVPVDMRSGEHKQPHFLSLNPFGQVPAFEDGDLKLFESRAINQYIARTYADKGNQLICQDLKKMAILSVWMEVEAHQFDPVASKLSWDLPWWALSLLCLSKRVHFIFVLRFFNDCFAPTLFHAVLALLLNQKWHLGLIIFSGAVSIRTNVLLYAPPLLLLMLKAMDIAGVFSALAGAAIVQILLGLPFLLAHPITYISGALSILSVSSSTFVFAHNRWCKHEGGLLNFLHSRFVPVKLRVVDRHSTVKLLNKEQKS